MIIVIGSNVCSGSRRRFEASDVAMGAIADAPTRPCSRYTPSGRNLRALNLCEHKEEDWHRIPEETPEDYIERVGGWPGANLRMSEILEREFGIPEDESKQFSLRSRSFHEQFFKEHLAEMLERGGSKYGAINYIRRKSDWTDDEIAAFVDSVGKWPK